MRAALAALIACLILLGAPPPGAANPARGRSAKGAQRGQKKQAKVQKRRAKARQVRPRSARRRAARAKKERARSFRRSRGTRSSRKGRRGEQKHTKSSLRQRLGEVRSRLVKAGLDRARAEEALKHISLGLPSEASPETPEDYLLAQPEYVVSYNRSRKVPNWSSWKLSAGDFGDTKRHNKFRRDDRIPESWKPASKADYKKSGFTRGHLVPSGARTANKKSNRSTFVLSNIVPQTRDNNGGAWHTLETYLRNQVQKRGKDVYVSAGPIFDGKHRTIGQNKVAVPNALWKVAVIVPKGTPPEKIGKDARVLSVIIPNNRKATIADTFEKFRVTPKQVEKRTGLRFFRHLPGEVRSALRSKLDRKKVPVHYFPGWKMGQIKKHGLDMPPNARPESERKE